MLKTYRDLIALRRARPELADPRLDRFVVEQDDRVVVLHRGDIRVVCNLGATEIRRPAGEVLLASNSVREEGVELVIPAESFVIYLPS
jgi:maltooligosyltrehalose trehalohydrolase